jgi:immune inhibitor A
MATHTCNNGGPCPIPPHPDLQAHLLAESLEVQQTLGAVQHLSHTHDGSLPLSVPTGYVVGLNDGNIFPESHYETPVPESVMVNAALERAPLRGAIRSVV